MRGYQCIALWYLSQGENVVVEEAKWLLFVSLLCVSVEVRGLMEQGSCSKARFDFLGAAPRIQPNTLQQLAA
jgi:hypothetical protein